MHTIPEHRRRAAEPSDISFISDIAAVRHALDNLNKLASNRVWFDKLPFQKTVSFRHHQQGLTTLTFIIDYLHPKAVKANSYRLDMQVSFQDTHTGRWICAGDQERVSSGLAKFAKDPSPVVELLAEFYMAAQPRLETALGR